MGQKIGRAKGRMYVLPQEAEKRMAKKRVEMVPKTGLPKGVKDPEELWASLSRDALKAVRRLVSRGNTVEIFRASNRGGASYKVAS